MSAQILRSLHHSEYDVSHSLELVIDALSTIIDPDSGKDIVRLGLVRDLKVRPGSVSMTIFFNRPGSKLTGSVEQSIREVVRQSSGDVQIDIKLDNAMIGFGPGVTVDGDSSSSGSVDGIANIIAVASGKGGVGKSTVAANLAISLAREGYDVGLVDTDIYGPSVPTMFGLESGRPKVGDDRQIIPLEKYGVKLLSMGFLVNQEKAVVWRGPMVSGAVKQFLKETAWGDLDFLILDLPPGTGDIQLTIVQTVSISGAVIVSTPQKVALADARRGVAMFEQVNVPVLGLIENMSWFSPPDSPEKKYYIFGEGGARRLAGELQVPFLGELPLDPDLRESCDDGYPLAARDDGHAAFTALAKDIARRCFIRNATEARTEIIEITRR